MKSYEHLFFDLDHTLWDFDTNSRDTLSELYQRHKLADNLTGTENEFLDTYIRINEEKWALYRVGKIDKKTLRRERFLETFAEFGLVDEVFSHEFEIEYIDTCPHKTTLLPGAIEVLEELQNKYHLHIITNGFSEVQEIKLTKSGLKPFFKQIVSSDEIGVNKPAAPIFVESLKRAGAKRSQSLMIGDNLVADIIGAKNCGIDQVYFNMHKQKHNERVTHEIKHLLELKNILG